MIIKLETLLENGIIDPNKITELVCDGKTVYKGYSDDIASFGKDYEFIKFNNTVNESFNTPTYTIEVKAKNPVNESFTSQFGLNTKADVIKSMKYFDYYDEDKKDALLEEIDYLCDLYNIDEGFNFVLDNEINNYVDIDVLTEKLTRYNVDEKLDKKIDKTADKNYTHKATTAGGFIGWFFGGIIGIFIGRFVGHNIAASAKQDKIDALYRYLKNDNELIGISNRMKSILNNDKLSKEDKNELKSLRKSFSSRLKVLKTNHREDPYGVKERIKNGGGYFKPGVIYEDLNNDELINSTDVLSENKQQVIRSINKANERDYKNGQKATETLKSGETISVTIPKVPAKQYDDNDSKFHRHVQGIVNGMEHRNGKDFEPKEREAVYDRVTDEEKKKLEVEAYKKQNAESNELKGMHNRANYQKKQLKKLNK